MKQDTSHSCFQKYLSLPEPQVEILLKNGQSLHGRIWSFIHGDEALGEPCILSWRIIPIDQIQLSMAAEELPGVLVPHHTIQQIRFLSDQSIYTY